MVYSVPKSPGQTPGQTELQAGGVMLGHEDPTELRGQELPPGQTSVEAYDAAREKAGVDPEREDQQTVITAGQAVYVMGRSAEILKSEQ